MNLMAESETMPNPLYLNRFWKNTQGLAYLEFALVFPILMLLFLGGVDLSHYIQAAQKTDKMTHTIVDLIAQAPVISQTDLDQIMQAVEHIMTPYDFSGDGAIIVSCIGYDDRERLVVKWQYEGNGALDRTSRIGRQGASPTLPEGFVVEARDNVIVAETYFKFHSMISDQLMEPIEFYRTAYYLPRIGELDVLEDD
jgi:Flp pilus assembly protein TadG